MEVFLAYLKLAVQNGLPQVPVDLPRGFGNLGQADIAIRIPFAKIVMVCLLIQLPAVVLAKALQIFPAWHRMLSPIF